MRLLALFLILFAAAAPAWAQVDAVLPKVSFSATAVEESGAVRVRRTIHYADGRLRIDGPIGGTSGFATTILDLNTGTKCVLMANHTFLVLPLDNELFRRFFAPVMAASGEKLGRQPMSGIDTTKYHFEGDGALDAGGFYWLSDTGIMLRRAYEDGVYGEARQHLEFLTDVKVGAQDEHLFQVPAGYRLAK
jgi:hypothetical protein